MGAVCYKPKPTTITQADILRALTDKHLKSSITEPDGVKTLKTDEQYSNNLLTFGTITQMFNYEGTTQETLQQINANNSGNNNQFQRPPQGRTIKQLKNANLNPNAGGLGQLELNILTYFGNKDEIYDTLTHLSRKSLYFMKRNYNKIESHPKLRNANEKIKFTQSKQIEEHTSGVNQLIKLSNKEVVTASDDCFMKFWNSSNMKCETSIPTETITCIALTGQQQTPQKPKDIIVAGCHSGNLLIVSVSQRAKKEQINNAHYNLIRVIVSLEALKNKYFVSADVCGIVKVWKDMLPKRSTYEDTAIIACALKNQRINLILLMPNTGTYQLIKTLKTQQKPTCLIQLTPKHIAIAVGQLKESSTIEIHDVNKNKMTCQLRFHKDMIDSMLKLEFPSEKLKSKNQYVTWFLSASRDRQIVLWKIIDGKVMRRNISKNSNNPSSSQTPAVTTQVGISKNNVLGASGLNNKGSNTGKNSMQRNSLNNNKNSGQKRLSNNSNVNKVQKRRQRNGSQDDFEDDDYQKSLDDDSDVEMQQQQDDMDNNRFQYEESKQDDRSNKNMMSEQSNALNQFRSDNDATQSPSFLQKLKFQQTQQMSQASFQDHYFSFDSGHKDFIRSMAQINNGNVLVTASEDKLIKVFSIHF
eukprot:403333373